MIKLLYLVRVTGRKMILENIIRKGIFGRISSTNKTKKGRKPGSPNYRNPGIFRSLESRNLIIIIIINNDNSNCSSDPLGEYYVTGITLNGLPELSH